MIIIVFFFNNSISTVFLPQTRHANSFHVKKFNIDKGSILLYGHVHNKHIPEVDEYYRNKLAFNVSMDVNDFEPRTLLELVGSENKEELFMRYYGNLVKGGLIN